MAAPGPDPRVSPEKGEAPQRLHSWKEIAAYLNISERSARRWEKTEALPVQRHQHQRRDSVYADPAALDAWWSSRGPLLAKQQQAGSPRQPRVAWRVGLPILAVVLAGAVYLGWQRWPARPPQSGDRIMLAVLPFENLSGNPDQEYFSDGLTEEMIAQLGRMNPERLGVIARTSTMQYKGSKKGVDTIGRELSVEYVLEGSVRRQAERVRISAQLIRVSDQTHLWAENYERDVGDFLALQLEIAAAVAGEIRLSLTAQQEARLASKRALNRDAFETYLRGRHALNQRTAESVNNAVRLFQAAIKADPAYAPPYAGLADAYNQMGTQAISWQSPRKTRQLARAAATKALEIDGELAEAHAAVGYSDLYDWQWQSAQASLQRALRLNSSYPWAHLWYASSLLVHGRKEEAVLSARRALELDPLSPMVETQLGWFLNFVGQEDEALQHFENVLQRDPDFVWALWQAGLIHLQRSHYDQAIAALEKAVVLSDRNPSMLGSLGQALAMAGRTAEAEKLLAEVTEMSRHRYVSPVATAGLHLYLGRRDRFFECLEEAFQERSNALLYLKFSPLNKPIRNDPRYFDLLRRVNFPE